MNTPPSPSGAEHTDGSSVRLGALVPLTRPSWVEAGRHLLAGLDLAVREVNNAGGIGGRPLELVVRDTAADRERAAAAVDELAGARAWPPWPAITGRSSASDWAKCPPFFAFEGWDTVAVLAAVLRSLGTDRAAIAESWPRVTVEGTRGPIRLSRAPGISVWQWAWTPVQVVDREPAEPDRFRILHTG
ncbi:ABC transporter substrate-binding protein [Streptomyces sp. NPDC006288]|uniref:ABC transporter substrate-binding protein n=1 Tax=Streptomyces sp. NPDC006288 TaxID=3156743 RepID=UPI0033AA9E02